MLAGQLQRYATALTARMENPVRVRHDLPPAPGSGAALCRRLRASSRRSHRPAGRIQRQGRTQNWIKPGGKVTVSERWIERRETRLAALSSDHVEPSEVVDPGQYC